MKRPILVLLALATVLATVPAARATTLTYDFTFLSTSSNAAKFISGAGAFTVDSTTSAITGISGTITDTIDNLTVPINGLISTPGDTYTFLGGTYHYDDLLLGGSLDNQGVYFGIDGSGDTVLLTDGFVDIYFPASGSESAGDDARSVTEETVALLPEPTSVLLVGTGFLCMAIVVFRRSKQGRLILTT